METNKKGLCPACKNSFERSKVEKELWPFCSKRCKMIDLGGWLSEKYVVKTNETAQEPEEE